MLDLAGEHADLSRSVTPPAPKPKAPPIGFEGDAQPTPKAKPPPLTGLEDVPDNLARPVALMDAATPGSRRLRRHRGHERWGPDPRPPARARSGTSPSTSWTSRDARWTDLAATSPRSPAHNSWQPTAYGPVAGSASPDGTPFAGLILDGGGGNQSLRQQMACRTSSTSQHLTPCRWPGRSKSLTPRRRHVGGCTDPPSTLGSTASPAVA